MAEFGTTKDFTFPLEQVLALLCDEDHIRAKYEQMGHRAFEPLSWELGGEVRTMHSRRRVPLEVPRFAKKILGKENIVEQRERWEPVGDGTWRNTWSIDVQGSPISIAGSALLRPTTAGCAQDVTGRASCSVPIIGGKIAAFVAKDAEKGLHIEDAIDRAALRRG
ncbi:MAG: DUF2505 domain-containing protein [Proteobacteria bacterium]|nr:DUF2505 domain-containing protein [Pseudomonadota bacterium]